MILIVGVCLNRVCLNKILSFVQFKRSKQHYLSRSICMFLKCLCKLLIVHSIIYITLYILDKGIIKSLKPWYDEILIYLLTILCIIWIYSLPCSVSNHACQTMMIYMDTKIILLIFVSFISVNGTFCTPPTSTGTIWGGAVYWNQVVCQSIHLSVTIDTILSRFLVLQRYVSTMGTFAILVFYD